MHWYPIFEADLKTAYRVVIERIKKHPVMAGFFIFGAVAVNFLVVEALIYIFLSEEVATPVYIEDWTGSIIYFSIILVKVMVTTYRKVLKVKEMQTLFSQNIKSISIVIGKYLANFIYILVQIGVVFIITYGIIIYHFGLVPVPTPLLLEGLLLGFLALSLGFAFPVFYQLKPIWKKMLWLFPNLIIIGASSIAIRYFPRDTGFFVILNILTLSSFLLVLATERYLLEAWSL